MRLSKMLGLLIVGCLYWLAVREVAETNEPWDSDAYWRLCYPVSLLFSAVSGYWLGKDGWAAGAILTFSQLPILLIGGISGLLMLGLSILCVLAVPAIAISQLAGRFAIRARST